MTTGPFAVKSESLTGLPSTPFSVKSGAFCPTSRALAPPASATLTSVAATTVRSSACSPVLGCLKDSLGVGRVCLGHNSWPGIDPPRNQVHLSPGGHHQGVEGPWLRNKGRDALSKGWSGRIDSRHLRRTVVSTPSLTPSYSGD